MEIEDEKIVMWRAIASDFILAVCEMRDIFHPIAAKNLSIHSAAELQAEMYDLGFAAYRVRCYRDPFWKCLRQSRKEIANALNFVANLRGLFPMNKGEIDIVADRFRAIDAAFYLIDYIAEVDDA